VMATLVQAGPEPTRVDGIPESRGVGVSDSIARTPSALCVKIQSSSYAREAADLPGSTNSAHLGRSTRVWRVRTFGGASQSL
jgi:hypothetical protein